MNPTTQRFHEVRAISIPNSMSPQRHIRQRKNTDKFQSPITEKRCRYCGRLLPVSCFYVKKDNADGYRYKCKQCRKAFVRQHYVVHREEILQKQRVFRAEHPKEYLESARQYRIEHHDKVREQTRKSVQKVRKAVLERITEAHAGFAMPLCAKCGFADTRALQIDHINGGGCKELRKMTNWTFYQHILHLPKEEIREKYQVLCANCNVIKKEEKRENYAWREQ